MDDFPVGFSEAPGVSRVSHVPEALKITRDGGEFALVFQIGEHAPIEFRLTKERAYDLKIRLDLALIMAMD